MIDKDIKYIDRENFRGGSDLGAGASGMGSGNTGGGFGGNDGARDRGMGMSGKTGDYSTGPTGGDGGGNQFTDLTKDVLNPNIDYVGPTTFGPTQKYSGDGIFSGYRNIDPLTGQPLSGLAYVGDRLKSLMSPSNIFGGILGLVNPLAGLAFRGAQSFSNLSDYDTLSDFAKGEFGLFQDKSPNIDKGRGSGVRPVSTDTTGIASVMVPPVKPIVDVQVNQPIKFEDMIPSANYIPPYTP